MDGLMQLVSEADKDRYISLLFCPEAMQPKLAAIYAFDIELEKIRRQVSEPQLGQIRLQWWRETLLTAYAGEQVAHPLVAALAGLRGTVPVSVFEAMLGAAEEAIFGKKPATLHDLEAWLGRSSSMVMQAATMVLGGGSPQLAGLAGVAFGLSRRLAHGEHWLIPVDWLPDSDAAQRISALAQHAEQRLAEARALPLGKDLLPAVLPASVSPLYIRAVMRQPLSPPLVSPLRRQVSIWWAARRERI